MKNGELLLKNEQTRELFEFTEFEMLDELRLGNFTCEEFGSKLRSNIQISSATQMKIEARRASAAAARVFLDKVEWLENFRKYGVTDIRDEPWIRDVARRISENEMKGRRKYELTTHRDDQQALKDADGDETVLLPDYSMRGGPGKKRIDDDAESIIKAVIEKALKSKREIIKRDIFIEVLYAVHLHNVQYPENRIRPPGQSTVSRRVQELIPQIEIDRKVMSPRALRSRYRSNSTPRFAPEIPLLMSEYDDVDTNAFLVGHKSKLPVGRCHMTSGICTASEMLLGASMGIQSRSFESAISAIHHSLQPKDMSHPDFKECNFGWDGYGLQSNILLDNATYNSGKAMKHQSREMQLKICKVRPYGPTAKSKIEHFNYVLQTACQGLPGWRGLEDDPEAVKKGMASAVLKVQNFRQFFFKWATGVYMNKPGTDGFTPRQRWQSHFTNRSPRVRWTANELAVFRLVPLMRKFRDSGGIMRLGLTYDNTWLSQVHEHFGKKSSVCVYIDRFDLSYVVVEHPITRERQRIPCTTPQSYGEYLTEYSQKLILKMCRDRGLKNPSLLDMQTEREQLIKLTEQMSSSNKLSVRKRAEQQCNYVSTGADGKDHFEEKTVVVEKVVTALEARMLELETIELEDEYVVF